MPELRLQETGDGSYYIYLPKKWMSQRNLKKGDIIDVYGAENFLVLTPKPISWQSKKKRILEFEVSDKPEDLYWTIMSSYITGCLFAKFFRTDRKDFSSSQINVANALIQKLRGIEHTLNRNELEYIDVVDYQNVNPYEEIDRMFKVVKSTLEQNRVLLELFSKIEVISDSLHRLWIYEKEQINPISFYIHRIISVFLEYPALCTKTIWNLRRCQHVAVATYALERLGDTIYGIGESFIQIYTHEAPSTSDLLAYPPEYIAKEILSHKGEIKNINGLEPLMQFYAQKNIELSQMLEQAEEVVCNQNVKKGICLRDDLKRWRTKFDRELVGMIYKSNKTTLPQIFAIGNRLRELSTYIESLAGRTCQFYDIIGARRNWESF